MYLGEAVLPRAVARKRFAVNLGGLGQNVATGAVSASKAALVAKNGAPIPLYGAEVTVNGVTLHNPYPNGVSVAHTGPNNTATTWTTAYHTEMGSWVANTGFGVAPIFTDDQMQLLADLNSPKGWEGHGIVSFPLHAHPDHYFLKRLDGTGESAAGIPGLLHFVAIKTKDGGMQQIWYTKDWATGYWKPSSAVGRGPPRGSFWTTLIIAAVLIVAAIVTYGAATGAFGAVLGGDVAATGAAEAGAVTATAEAGATVAPEIASFVPAAIDTSAITAASSITPALTIGTGAAEAGGGFLSTAITAVKTIGTLASAASSVEKAVAGPAAPGQPVAVQGAPSYVPSTVPVGTKLVSPTGTVVVTSSPGAVPPGYTIAPQDPSLNSPPAGATFIYGSGDSGGYSSPAPAQYPTYQQPTAAPSVASASLISGVSNTTLLAVLAGLFALSLIFPRERSRYVPR